MQKPASSCYVLDAGAEPPFLTKECVPVSATGDTNLAAPCVGPTFGICWHFKKMGMEAALLSLTLLWWGFPLCFVDMSS